MSNEPNGFVQSEYDQRQDAKTKRNEIKLISHSDLFYWWPVWLGAFIMAGFTYFEGNRMAIVPAETKLTVDESKGVYDLKIDVEKSSGKRQAYYNEAVARTDSGEAAFPSRMSRKIWLGSVFGVVLILTIVITNIPLRGLWSFMVLIMIVVIALLITVFDAWDSILELLGGLHIHINLAGYVFIGTTVFIIWAAATYIFDRRSYIIFTPGHISYCEHIGAAMQTFPTIGVSMTKQRDDLFRHYILGFGSGDLILHIGQAEQREIKLPNVLFIGWKLPKIERILAIMRVAD